MGLGSGSSANQQNTNIQGSSQTADLMKIIEDYSKQNEAKAKELEVLTAKFDKKAEKLNVFKKKNTDSEIKVAKLRNTIDSVKSFLKIFNSNFVKSMKQ